MGKRITECRGIGEAAAKDCVVTRKTAEAAEPCTVAADVCSLTTGDAGVKAKEQKEEEATEEIVEDCCCCDC